MWLRVQYILQLYEFSLLSRLFQLREISNYSIINSDYRSSIVLYIHVAGHSDDPYLFQVYYKIFCAARRIVLEERRAQSHLEAHCYLDIEPTVQQHQPAAVNRQLNTDVQTSHGSPPTKQHRSSSASTTVSRPIDSSW